ncbi:MAG TPA: PadR family transcriptional regulator [Candidatus Nanoarchaeia archaeon]|nr:PadR family transcriptional regulator [Candidatus Nanoarchaeia archaeon]
MQKELLKGHLSFLILHLLSQKQLSGKGIVDEIAKRKGNRLSPGTIYPSLEVLKQKGFVQVAKKIDKEKVYDLTADGKNALDEGKILFQKMFYDI